MINDDEGLIEPNIVTYNTVLSCWSKAVGSGSTTDDATIPKEEIIILKRVRAILDSIITMSNSNNNIQPDTVTYTTIMNIYAKLGDPKGANEILQIMKKDYNSGKGNKDAKPNIRTYNTLINAWSKKSFDSNNNNAPKEAETLLKEIIDLHSNGLLENGPDTVTYNTVLNCWSKSNNDDGPQRALNILKIMIIKYKEHQQQQQQLRNNINNNNSNGAAVNKNNRNKRKQQTKIPPPPRPNTITYSIVMNAFASQGNVGKTREVFQMMKDDYNNKYGNKNAKPNLIVYNTLIKAYSKYQSTDNDTAVSVSSPPLEVENILQDITTLHKKGLLKEGPSYVTYRLMIVCLKKYYGTEERVRELIGMLPPRTTTTTKGRTNKRRQFHK
jgi:pentatricopeptide repeat protein